MATIIDSTDFNRYEVVKMSPYNDVPTNVALTGQPIYVTIDPGTGTKSTALDAFGRLRVSSPLTLFDSSHRYRDNGLWNTLTATGGTSTFNSNQGLIDLSVTTTSGSKVYRETKKVFPYLPGKSLLVMTTFVMSPAKTNLRQRLGYFGDQNGVFLELDGEGGTVLSFVERSYVSGSVVDTKINQSSWNYDKMDGTGPSKMTLDITKAQILWTDIEWLGLGTIRIGFIIEGKFILCHQFHHANLIMSTYITTASLPLRYEIENTGTTASSSVLKQICSTVMSEGGYELRGLQQAVSTPITSATATPTAGTYYPIISIRLKTSPNFLDAVVVLTALSLIGTGNGINYNWKVIGTGETTGGTWVSAGTDSSVEYNITGTSFTVGRTLSSGYFSSSNQSNAPVNLLREALFKFQLERNTFTSTAFELTLVTASDSSGHIFASMDWEEQSR